MKGKRAIITVELVDESLGNSNESIAKELLNWFKEETLPAPWVKQITSVVVQQS